MANKRLKGFSGKDYYNADKLGWSNENFNALGSKGMKDVLNNKTSFKPAVQATNSNDMYGSTNEGLLAGLSGNNSNMNNNTQAQFSAQNMTDSIMNPGYNNNITQASGLYGQASGQSGPLAPTMNPMQQSQMDLNKALTENMSYGIGDGLQDAGIIMNGVGSLYGAIAGNQLGRDSLDMMESQMDQNMAIQQAEYDNRAAQQQNLGTTFSANG